MGGRTKPVHMEGRVKASLCHDLKLKDTSTLRGIEMFLLACRHLQTMTQHSTVTMAIICVKYMWPAVYTV